MSALPPRHAAFLDTLERRTFDWFWETSNASNGLTPDRTPNTPFASIAAVGFALTAYPIGVERGYVTRAQAAARTLATLRFFWQSPQNGDSTNTTGRWGFYYHFLDMNTGFRYRTVELSTIDTALLLAGILFAQQYYDQSTAAEVEIRALADSLYRRVEWSRFHLQHPLITMAWHPERGFGQARYEGYDEAMLLYVLALGSPTHPSDPGAWAAFTSTYTWADYYGQPHVTFAPMFGHQYSHLWIDFRGIHDAYMREKGIDYFENSRRATIAQRAYATENPGRWRDYSADVWGLTASDGPRDTTLTYQGESRRFHSYWARGATQGDVRDDGTISSTAAGGSIPFAPDITVATLVHTRERYGADLFTRYGFVDAFNPSLQDPAMRTRNGRVIAGKGWFDDNHLGIDQGPIIGMIANFRSGFVWETMKSSPYIVRGLCRAGFTGGWLTGRC